MNNYLLQLLKEVKTLIIPGLGALTVTNESTGEILFMPYLKFDDGTLAKHIASKENIEQNDASNMISKFVREVTAELDKGNSYDMYQFGRFVKVDGEIAFEAWNAASASDQKPVETPAKEEPKAEIPPVAETPKEEPAPVVKEEKIIPPVVETPKVETPKEEKVIPPVAEEPKKPVETPKAEEPKVEKIVPPVVETPKAAEPKKEPAKPVAQKEEKAQLSKTEVSSGKDERLKEPVKKSGKESKAPKEKKKTSVFAYVLWGFLVLVLGAGTFIAIQFDTLKKDFPILADLAGENDNVAKGSEDVKQLEEDKDVNIDSETASEPIPEDEVQVVEDKLPETTEPVKPEPKKTVTPAPKKEEKASLSKTEASPGKGEKPKEAPKPTPKPKVTVTVNKKPVTKTPKTTSTANFDGTKAFHIIAGSFGSEANANRLAGKLQSKGFPEASVTMNGGMYRVSVKGFATLNEATAEAASVQSSVPGAWVMKM